jgi:hypothetical protein
MIQPPADVKCLLAMTALFGVVLPLAQGKQLAGKQAGQTCGSSPGAGLLLQTTSSFGHEFS